MILYKYEPSIEVAEYERDFGPLADSFMACPGIELEIWLSMVHYISL